MKLNIFQLQVSDSKLKQEKFNFRVSNWRYNFSFFDFELVTREQKNRSLIFELVLKIKLFIFQFRVSNSKVEKQTLNFRVSNSKFNLIFYEVVLVTRKKNFSKSFRVSNSKCDLILRNSVS